MIRRYITDTPRAIQLANEVRERADDLSRHGVPFLAVFHTVVGITQVIQLRVQKPHRPAKAGRRAPLRTTFRETISTREQPGSHADFSLKNRRHPRQIVTEGGAFLLASFAQDARVVHLSDVTARRAQFPRGDHRSRFFSLRSFARAGPTEKRQT